MIVKLRGIGFVNKGAELMFYAIDQQLPKMVSPVILTSDLVSGSFAERREVGLHHMIWWDSKKLPQLGSMMNTAASLIPSGLRKNWQIVLDQEVDVVLDASGFAYSDQQGPGPTEIMANLSSRWRQEGKKIVLMPQAFGPFKGERIKTNIRRIVSNSDLVFARDRVSYEHLEAAGVDLRSVKISPDFTNLVEGKLPPYFEDSLSQPCIIPNFRMLDRTGEQEKANYLPFLSNCLRCLFEMGFEPYILIHETASDFELAGLLEQQLGRKIRTLQEKNSLYNKGLLGRSQLVISSRFHGLVSALSQGTPSLATGWSHKYQMLLEDYGCPESLMQMTETPAQIREKIESLVTEPGRSEWVTKVKENGQKQKEQVLQMWQMIKEVL
jgi:colanic acid/amylovoran biosynthesis protein